MKIYLQQSSTRKSFNQTPGTNAGFLHQLRKVPAFDNADFTILHSSQTQLKFTSTFTLVSNKQVLH